MQEQMPMFLRFFMESMMTQVKHHTPSKLSKLFLKAYHKYNLKSLLLLFFLSFINSTGIINLKASKTHKNKFEQGYIDEFTVEAVNLGDLKKIRIGHDNSGKFLKF